MAARPSVLLLRSAREPDPYVAALEEAGFTARCVPVLTFEMANRGALAERLRRPAAYAGLVLTSPRAVLALDGLDLDAWQAVPTFVVGPATAEAAAQRGLSPVGEDAGHADALANHIVQRSLDRPLLFLCGDRRRDTLPDRLEAACVALEELVVYRTIGDAGAFVHAVEQRPDWVVFFSPSGVETADVLAGPSWNRILKAAIGPTTAEALRDAGRTPAAVADAPTPEALADALLHAHRSSDA